MSETNAQKAIRQYAQQQLMLVTNKKKCSCHAMADIWGYAVQYYIGRFIDDKEHYVRDVAYILSGVDEWATKSDGTEVGQSPSYGGFNDSGFKPEFKDGSNQVRHFSAGVMGGFRYGLLAYMLHGVLRPDSLLRRDSPQDEALNDESTWLGYLLKGGLSVSGVQRHIENNVCLQKCGICNGGAGR
ncbi:MAG: hypothetical protein WCI11_17380 [Candidatus Methylumidiphilus sp.]